jgi:hypothetical protein
MCPDYLINNLFSSRTNTNNPWLHFLTTLGEHLRFFGVWGTVLRRRMPSLWAVIPNYFWDGAATKIAEKIKSVGFVSGAWLYHENKRNHEFFLHEKRTAGGSQKCSILRLITTIWTRTGPATLSLLSPRQTLTPASITCCARSGLESVWIQWLEQTLCSCWVRTPIV